eukprot:364612-Chlamydomonas_euryale.AAC.5
MQCHSIPRRRSRAPRTACARAAAAAADAAALAARSHCRAAQGTPPHAAPCTRCASARAGAAACAPRLPVQGACVWEAVWTGACRGRMLARTRGFAPRTPSDASGQSARFGTDAGAPMHAWTCMGMPAWKVEATHARQHINMLAHVEGASSRAAGVHARVLHEHHPSVCARCTHHDDLARVVLACCGSAVSQAQGGSPSRGIEREKQFYNGLFDMQRCSTTMLRLAQHAPVLLRIVPHAKCAPAAAKGAPRDVRSCYRHAAQTTHQGSAPRMACIARRSTCAHSRQEPPTVSAPSRTGVDVCLHAPSVLK